MNYVESMVGKHAIKIRIPTRHGIAKRELLGQNRLKIANCKHTGAVELLNFLDVAVGDFSAANYANIQHQFRRLTALTFAIWRVRAAARGSRLCPMASMARYICQAVMK